MHQLKTHKVILLFGFLVIVLIATFFGAPKLGQETKVVFEKAIISLKENTIGKIEEKPLVHYIEVTDSCGPYFAGTCVNVRSGPGKDYKVVTRLRNGVVLQVENDPVKKDGQLWYKIVFNEWLRYPERVSKDWYVSGEYVTAFQNVGPQEQVVGTSTKHIIVDRSDQKLYAYDGKTLFMEQSISTGIELTPTPRGVFHVFKKTPSRYMQGPIPGISTHNYDLPGVPWNLYFTEQGAVIHGAYWHDHFGKPWSNGCVNLPPEVAKKLYDWADVGMEVRVQD